MYAASVVHDLVVTIVINMRLLDVSMRMSMTTFAKHNETNKVNYFLLQKCFIVDRDNFSECERKGL